MSIPLITWEAPPPQCVPEGADENPLLQLSLHEVIQRDRDSCKQQQQQQQQQQLQQLQQQQAPHYHQQRQQQQRPQRRVLLRPSPSNFLPLKETAGRWHDLLRAVCIEALQIPDVGWESVRLLSPSENPVPSSLFVVCGGLVTPEDVLAFFQPFNPLHIDCLLQQQQDDPEGDTGDTNTRQCIDSCCVVFPSAAAAAAALQQRSSPCELLLQRHKEELLLRVEQQQQLLEEEAEEGELQQQRQQQQQQLEALKEELSNLNKLETIQAEDVDLRMCLEQLAKWRRTVSVPTSRDGKAYQLLLRRTAAADIPAAAAAADSSRVLRLRPTLNFTMAAAAAGAAVAAAPLGSPNGAVGLEERALLHDTVALQASRGHFRSLVLRGALDLGEGPPQPTNSRVKLTPRAEGEMETEESRQGGPPGRPPLGALTPPLDSRGPSGRAEAEARWEMGQDRPLAARLPTPRQRSAKEGPPAGSPREEAPMGAPRSRLYRHRSRSRSGSWDLKKKHKLRDRERRQERSRRRHRRGRSSSSSSRSSSSSSSRERRRRRRRRHSNTELLKDKNRKGRGFDGGSRGMAADRELERRHNNRRGRDRNR